MLSTRMSFKISGRSAIPNLTSKLYNISICRNRNEINKLRTNTLIVIIIQDWLSQLVVDLHSLLDDLLLVIGSCN